MNRMNTKDYLFCILVAIPITIGIVLAIVLAIAILKLIGVVAVGIGSIFVALWDGFVNMLSWVFFIILLIFIFIFVF